VTASKKSAESRKIDGESSLGTRHTRQAVEGAIELAKEHFLSWEALLAKHPGRVPRWRLEAEAEAEAEE
jgi:LDH2 family malate/lactate/ureidoglycolate dehydrogenase